jgi:hypothetical protein
VEQINPYAVVRNTATYEAYRAYMRDAYKASQPFFALGMLPMLLMPGAAVLMETHTLHRSLMDSRWAFTAVIASLSLGGLSMGVGFLRMAKYRRDHPIPNEWRQIPIVGPPPIRRRQSPRA